MTSPGAHKCARFASQVCSYNFDSSAKIGTKITKYWNKSN